MHAVVAAFASTALLVSTFKLPLLTVFCTWVQPSGALRRSLRNVGEIPPELSRISLGKAARTHRGYRHDWEILLFHFALAHEAATNLGLHQIALPIWKLRSTYRYCAPCKERLIYGRIVSLWSGVDCL
jgi:hypothetical protein